MSAEQRFEPHKSIEFSKWFRDWDGFTRSSTAVDGPESVEIANYLYSTVGIDRRNIATGGASDYEFVIHYPRPNLANSYGQSQWMPILLIMMIMDIAPKKRVLGLSGGLDRFRLEPFQDIFGSEIIFLNNKKLALYEKFQKSATKIDYGVIETDDLVNGSCEKFDMIIGWSQDFENPFLPVGAYIDSLSSGGVIVIQNTSDSVFLYQNDTQASSVWQYHEELKEFSNCRVYHIPIFYGLTIIVKD